MAQYQRIVVLGVTGSGKTTFAQMLAARVGYRHIEMDALHWLPHWTEKPIEAFQADIAEAVSSESWVMDGNYSKVRDIVWSRAEAIIWLDYPLPLILWRLTRRTINRILSKEVLWNDNRESFRNQFRRDSLFVWAFQSYHKQQQTYPALFQQPEYAHISIIRLTSPQAAEDWLKSIQKN
ncbi:MAG: adenylate kinase [Chloroflexota bacterium]